MSKTYKPLDDLLKGSGLRMEAISERIGLEPSGFYRMRLNPKKLTLEKIQRISDATGIDSELIYKVSKNFKK